MRNFATSQARFSGLRNGFHQGWCNSQTIVNETLQRPQIVLVSDPFTKDSDDPAVL